MFCKLGGGRGVCANVRDETDIAKSDFSDVDILSTQLNERSAWQGDEYPGPDQALDVACEMPSEPSVSPQSLPPLSGTYVDVFQLHPRL